MTNPPLDIPSVHPYEGPNEKWLSYVHPRDWTNPTPDGRYNLLVIGAGPAGLVVAAGAAGLGAKVALVEKHLMGGDCLNVGCVPSKALIRCGKAAAAVRDAGNFGVRVNGDVTVDFPAVMNRMRELRASISHHDSADRFSDLGIDVFIGEGQFTGPDTFEIDGKKIDFARACIATGARAAAPPIPGLDTIDHLTNESLFSLTELPKRFGIVGAGPIGCEMAQSFARFGSEVYLFEAMHGILTNDDQEAAEVVKEQLLSDGVNIYCCGKNLTIDKRPDGINMSVTAHKADDDPSAMMDFDITVDQVLISAGRKPNVENLGLESANVDYDKKGITVNDVLQTTNRNIYAAGDCCARYQFTHAADAMARIVIQNALFSFGPLGKTKRTALTIPWCTYTEPELAHVGRSESSLKESGTDYQTITINYDQVDRAILDGDTEGFAKIHVDSKGQILGATIVGHNAGDLIAELSVAATHGLGLAGIAKSIHAYPTQIELLKKAGDAFNRTKLTPTVEKLFDTILRWRR